MIVPLDKMKQTNFLSSNNSIHRQINNLKEIVKKRDNELVDLKQAIKTHLKLTRQNRYQQLQSQNNEDEVLHDVSSADMFSTLNNSKLPISKVSHHVWHHFVLETD